VSGLSALRLLRGPSLCSGGQFWGQALVAFGHVPKQQTLAGRASDWINQRITQRSQICVIDFAG